MDLDRYVEEELAEERALGHGSAGGQRGPDDGYPGDRSVEVSASAVTSSRLTVAASSGGWSFDAVSSPGSEAPSPAILVIHENKGLVPYIENTVRRLAAAGFVAAAPDLLAPWGGTDAFEDLEEVVSLLKDRRPEELLSDLQAALDALAGDPRVDAGRLAVVGFCFGGGLAWRLLAADARLAAGVPFYGPPAPADELAKISVPVLAIYGETDERITSTLRATESAMAGQQLETLVLEGAGHAFHNDTNPDRYDAAAARRAWDETLRFLQRTLRDSPDAG